MMDQDKLEIYLLKQTEKFAGLSTQVKGMSDRLETTGRRQNRTIGWLIGIFCAFVGVIGVASKCTYDVDVKNNVLQENLSDKVNTGTLAITIACTDSQFCKIQRVISLISSNMDTLSKEGKQNKADLIIAKEEIKEIKTRLRIRGCDNQFDSAISYGILHSMYRPKY